MRHAFNKLFLLLQMLEDKSITLFLVALSCLISLKLILSFCSAVGSGDAVKETA
jgi:hypothetical protein